MTELYGPWEIAGYQVRIDCTDGVRLVAARSGTDLKALPTAVRESEELAWIKVSLEAATQHRRQLKALLENALSESIPLSGEDLAMMALDPVGKPRLAGLLVEIEGIIGAPVPESWALETLKGDLIPLGAPAVVVHPARLHALGTLESWDRWLSGRWIKQPFKQIRREFFFLFGVVLCLRSYSDRFVGETVNWMQGRALLEGRGWYRVTKPGAERIYRRAKVTAHVEFRTPMSRSFSTDDVVLNRVFFLPQGQLPQNKGNPGMPVDRVPPIVFSETLRDVGLVAKVAGRQEFPTY